MYSNTVGCYYNSSSPINQSVDQGPKPSAGSVSLAFSLSLSLSLSLLTLSQKGLLCAEGRLRPPP